MTANQILATQYGYTAYAFAANLKDLSDEDGLLHPATGGNCPNWVAGHILHSRVATLQVLGQEIPFAPDKYDRYKRYSEPVMEATGTVPLSEMLADFAATNEAVQAGVAALTPEVMSAKAPFSPFDDEKETVGSLAAGLVFHESYHIGQLGVLRRVVGAPGAIK